MGNWKNILKDNDIDHYNRGGEIDDRLEEHYDEHSSYKYEDYDAPTQDELIDELLSMHKNMQMGAVIEGILVRVDSAARKRQKVLEDGQWKILNLVRELKDMDEDDFDPLHLSDENKKFYFEELEKISLPVYLDLKRAIKNYI